jgi:hypothetical protein
MRSHPMLASDMLFRESPASRGQLDRFCHIIDGDPAMPGQGTLPSLKIVVLIGIR